MMNSEYKVMHLKGYTAMERFGVEVPVNGDRVTKTPDGWWILNNNSNGAYGPFSVEGIARKELEFAINGSPGQLNMLVVKTYTK
jgi:hypothetical protein